MLDRRGPDCRVARVWARGRHTPALAFRPRCKLTEANSRQHRLSTTVAAEAMIGGTALRSACAMAWR